MLTDVDNHELPWSSMLNIVALNSFWPVTPCGVGDLGQHRYKQGSVAWQHQTITWTDVELLLTRPSGIHLRVMFTQMLKK